MDRLAQLLQVERLTEIVDIGANPIDGDPPYKILLTAQLCNVTGFEPQSDALQQLNVQKSTFERYLPYAVGDGQLHQLNVCRYSGMTSLLEPDQNRRTCKIIVPADTAVAPLKKEAFFNQTRVAL